MKAVRFFSAVLATVTILSVSAYAEHRGHDRGGYYAPRHGYSHGNWIIPLMVGGVIGYALSEPHRETVTYVQPLQPQVIYQTPIYQTQPIYQEQWVYFNDCDCQRKVLVPVR